MGTTPKTSGPKNNKKGVQSSSGEIATGNREGEEWEEEGKGDDVGNQEGVKDQKVYVLERGFVGWQEMFGEDERLTEGYSKELWKDGYWM
jgi:hypothetical protein